MSHMPQHTRIMIHLLFSFILFVFSLYGGYKVTQSTYTFAENLIYSEAERMTQNNVSEMTLIVTPQTTLKHIATTLYKEGFISNKYYFLLEAKLEKSSENFISGEYTVRSNMSSNEILELLTTDPSNK